jgi:zinc protease
VNDKDAYIVEVMTNGKKSTEYYDVASGLLVKQVSSQETPEGAINITSEFGDYREVPGANGYKLPYSVKQAFGPQAISATVETVDINKGIADTEFN